MTRLALPLGAIALVALWSGPLALLLPGSFSAHMAMHMGVVALAAPLLAFGAANRSIDPVRWAPHLCAPIPASFVELGVVWSWHAPALHHFARHTTIGLVLEQGTFLLSALWVWSSAVGGDPNRAASRRALGVAALLLTSMHMTLLGALIALAPRALYAHAHHGTDMLADQQLGGAIMLAAGGASYLAGALVISAGLLRRVRT